MILSGTPKTDGNRVTLDDLFRRAGVRHADALALVDPPDCERLTGRPPRRLTYAQADRAISALAARLRSFGLQTDTVVAIQLANTVDSIIALLGVLRAGMIAAPLPLLWRMRETVDALSPIGAKAIITSTRIGAYAKPISRCRWRLSCSLSATSAVLARICPTAWCRSTIVSTPRR